MKMWICYGIQTRITKQFFSNEQLKIQFSKFVNLFYISYRYQEKYVKRIISEPIET